MGKGIDLAHQFRIGQEAGGGRGDENAQGGHHVLMQGMVEKQPVHDNGQQHDPEGGAEGEKEPGDFNKSMMNTGYRHDDIADGGNEPGRTDMMGFKMGGIDPGVDHHEGQNELQYAARCPQDE